MADTPIQKRHVRGRSTAVVGYDADGKALLMDHTFEDFVPADILDAYLADARTRWQSVEVVSDEHNPGPGGDHGVTHFPHHLSDGHPHQGRSVKLVDGTYQYHEED